MRGLRLAGLLLAAAALAAADAGPAGRGAARAQERRREGIALYGRKRWEAAAAAFARAYAAGGDEADAGWIGTALASIPAARRLTLARRLAARFPRSPAIRTALARAEMSAGHAARAAAEIDSLARDFPGDARLQDALGAIYLDGGDWADAVAFYRRRAQAAPGDLIWRYWLGYSLEREGLWPEAAAQYEWVVAQSQDPGDYVDAYHRLSALDPAAAAPLEQAWLTQVAAGPPALKPYRLLAEAFFVAGDDASLERLCAAAVDLFPGERSFADFLADVYFRRRDWGALVSLRRRRAESDPQAGLDDYALWADAVVHARDFAGAETALRRAAEAGLASSRSGWLAARLAVLDRLRRAVPDPQPEADAGCVFSLQPPPCGGADRCGGRLLWRASCGAETLVESSSTFRASGGGAPAYGRLARALLTRIEAVRFQPDSPRGQDIPAELREKLRSAGYLPR